MRKYGRCDANHTATVAALRKLGCIVVSTASVGGGCPDLLVGWRGMTVLMEVKDGHKAESRRALTAAEADFHRRWSGGPCRVVLGPDEAVNYMIALDAAEHYRSGCHEQD